MGWGAGAWWGGVGKDRCLRLFDGLSGSSLPPKGHRQFSPFVDQFGDMSGWEGLELRFSGVRAF